MDAAHTKDYWRAEARRRRKELGAEGRAAASEVIMRRLLAHEVTQRADLIALTASFGTEVHTHGLIKELLARGKRVVLPRVIHWKHELELRQITTFPDGFDKGDFGILEPNPQAHPMVVEPEAVDLFFVPALIYDRTRHRIGYGGGYFDRLLKHPHRKAIGFAFACQVIDCFEHQPWDRPVDEVITEEQMF